MAPDRFRGMYVATLTPLSADDHVDAAAIGRQVDFLIRGGVAGLSPAGTTGEFLYLTPDERALVVAETVHAAARRVPVMAGVWGLNIEEAASLAARAEEAGADAVFLPPPIYYPADDSVIYRWYGAIRRATRLPVFAYNIPSYASNAISLACVDRLVTDGVIVGIKDSSGKAERMRGLMESVGGRATVMAASDAFATEGRKLGAQGFISAIANVYPRAFARLWEGDEGLQPDVDALRDAVKAGGGIPALKYLASRRGLDLGASRLPFSELTAEQRNVLDAAHEAAAVTLE